MNQLRCHRCGAFVTADHESRSDYAHYTCINCMSTGYIYGWDNDDPRNKELKGESKEHTDRAN